MKKDSSWSFGKVIAEPRNTVWLLNWVECVGVKG
jgi:hypothetical protein